MALLARHNQADAASVREVFRPALEALPADDTERLIVDAHDPTVAFNPSARLIVTEHTLTMLETAMRWSAQVLGQPLPDAAFRTDARQTIARGFTTMDHPNQEKLAHLDSNLAVALPSLTREPVAEQRAALLKWGEVNAPMRLAANTAAALEYRTRQLRVAAGGSSMGGQMATNSMMQQMTQRQMQQNLWSMRHPECGPVGGHPSSCSQAPIFTPIRPF